jgi:hypothetical protein
MTAEQRAQRNGQSRAYAAAVEQARGRSARHRHSHACAHFRSLFRHIFATASRAATALLLVRSCARASVCRARRARPAASVGTLVRVCCQCCAAPARTAETDQLVSWSHARYLTMHCECAFPPTQLELTRGVAGQTSHGGDEGGAFPRGACQGERWRPPAYLAVLIASEVVTVRRLFWGLFVSELNFRAFPAVKKNCTGKSDVRSSRRSSATLRRRRWSRTSRRRTSTPRLPTFC